MTTSSRPESPTASSESATIKSDPEWLAEAAEESVRNNLGLRPVKYRNHEKKGSHPDQRPCPSA